MGPRHQKLFSEYVEKLRAAQARAEEWWASLIRAELALTTDRRQALLKVRDRWPAGPAAHPWVIAVLHDFFLACDVLNRELRSAVPPPEPPVEDVTPHELVVGQARQAAPDTAAVDVEISPSLFLGEGLLTPATHDLARFIGKLTYWPVGLDDQGRYV
jgi:hypothetical protein